MNAAAPEPFELEADGLAIAGEADGAGPPIFLLHGLTATRRYVVHGSRMLARAGYRVISYDARGHGESGPAPPEAGYSFPELAADLSAVIGARAETEAFVLAGHSMGAHTLAAYALAAGTDRLAGLVAIGPATLGEPPSKAQLERWDALADGLERDGVDGFIAVYDRDLEPAWRETVLRFTRDRLGRHRDLAAIARALREVPRSQPFHDPADLARLDVPALVVASHDESDPGHPYAVAAAWAKRLPRARLVSEEPGASPLAWQGGGLSREIAAFLERQDVAARLRA